MKIAQWWWNKRYRLRCGTGKLLFPVSLYLLHKTLDKVRKKMRKMRCNTVGSRREKKIIITNTGSEFLTIIHVAD